MKKKWIFSYGYMKKTISGYGFCYSLKDFLKVTFLVFVGLGAAGWMYQLKIGYILLTMAAAALSLPVIVTAQFRYMYEQKRFADAVTYMEQMIYMFKKKPQLLYALREAKEVLDGNIRETCERAVAYLEKGQYKENLYKESLAELEEQYGNERMYTLHRFMFQVEEEGGTYQYAINLILDDLKNWVQRVYEFQKERKRIKNNIILSIFAALLICLLTTKIFPSEYSVAYHAVYQWMTTLMILLLILLYTLVQSYMNGAWLTDSAKEEERLQEKYLCVVEKRPQSSVKKQIPLIVLLGLASVYVIFGSKQYGLLVGIAIAAFLVLTAPGRRYNRVKKQVIRELEKSFPEWIRNLTVRLQRQPVVRAIEAGLEDAPSILRPAIRQMLEEFQNDLVSIKPYQNFLKDFEVPEIHSAMKMLYVLNSAGRDEMTGQLNALVERNMKLQEKGERMKQEDQNAISGFMVALPMIISFVKLITDMILLITEFLKRMPTF